MTGRSTTIVGGRPAHVAWGNGTGASAVNAVQEAAVAGESTVLVFRRIDASGGRFDGWGRGEALRTSLECRADGVEPHEPIARVVEPRELVALPVADLHGSDHDDTLALNRLTAALNTVSRHSGDLRFTKCSAHAH
eukprot:6205844-Pleurochrysis_carterae.AAC.2